MDDILDIPPLPRAPLVLEHEEGDPGEEQAIDNLLEQYGADNRAVIKFYRVRRGEPDGLVEELHPGDFNFLHLAKKYGRGTYRIKLFAPDIQRGGRLVQRMNRTEAYEGEVDAPHVPVAAPVAASSSDAIERLALVMVSGFQELGKLIVSTQQNQPKPPTMGEMLQDMVLMRQAMGLDGRPSSEVGMDKMLGLLQQGIDLGKELGGGGNDDPTSGLLKVAEKTLPSIAEIVGKAMERNPTPPSVHVPVVARRPPQADMAALPPNAAPEGMQVPTNPATPVNPQPQQENPAMFGINRYSMMKPYLTQLADTFARNPDTDPYAYAVLLLDNISDTELSMLLSDAKLLDNLAEVEPRVTAQRPFWESILATIRELTSPENEGTSDLHVPEQAPTNPAGSAPAEPGKTG